MISRSLSCCVLARFVDANGSRVCFSFFDFELDEITGKLSVFWVDEASSKAVTKDTRYTSEYVFQM